MVLEFMVLGLTVLCLGFGDWGLGGRGNIHGLNSMFKVWNLRFRVHGSGLGIFTVLGLGCRVSGLVFSVYGTCLVKSVVEG